MKYEDDDHIKLFDWLSDAQFPCHKGYVEADFDPIMEAVRFHYSHDLGRGMKMSINLYEHIDALLLSHLGWRTAVAHTMRKARLAIRQHVNRKQTYVV